jgi:hypothetical protein
MPVTAQVTRSSVKLRLSLSEFQKLNIFYAFKKLLCFIKVTIFAYALVLFNNSITGIS